MLNFGFANADARTPITPDTLFQVGSISKLMTAALLHQFAAEGRLQPHRPDQQPAARRSPLPRGNAIQVQHLLDHVAGLPGDAPMFPRGGLWTAYAPGAHWHYSNTGYEILGKLAEHVGGKPLGQLLEERLFTPLGMSRSPRRDPRRRPHRSTRKAMRPPTRSRRSRAAFRWRPRRGSTSPWARAASPRPPTT